MPIATRDAVVGLRRRARFAGAGADVPRRSVQDLGGRHPRWKASTTVGVRRRIAARARFARDEEEPRRRWADPIAANARASAWPFERGRRAVRARPRGSRGITACARAKRRVESGLGGCQAFLGRLHLAVDDRAQVIVLVTIIVTVIVIVVGLRRRGPVAGACWDGCVRWRLARLKGRIEVEGRPAVFVIWGTPTVVD